MDQEKKDRLLQKFNEWLKKEPTDDEEDFAHDSGDHILGLGFIGGLFARDAEIKALIDALESSETQMSQMEKGLSQDSEFLDALAEVRKAIADGRELVK